MKRDKRGDWCLVIVTGFLLGLGSLAMLSSCDGLTGGSDGGETTGDGGAQKDAGGGENDTGENPKDTGGNPEDTGNPEDGGNPTDTGNVADGGNPADGGGGDAGVLPPNRHRCPLDMPQKVYGQQFNSQVTLDKDETWSADNVYLVFGKFYLNGHTLTIPAGTTVCFDYEGTPPRMGEPAFGEMLVDDNSTLKILGTDSKHVVFTQKNTFDQYYSGITFTANYKPESTVQYLDVYNAGASGGGWAIDSMSQHAPALDLQNVHFYSMERKGVNVRNEEGLTRTSRLHFHNHGSEHPEDSYFLGYHLMRINVYGAKTLFEDMVTVYPGLPKDSLHVSLWETMWAKDVTFHKLSIPWHFIPDVKVAGDVNGPAAVVTVDPGVTFLMDAGAPPKIGDSYNMKGEFVAVGTAALPIKFTSMKTGTTASGDPAPGDWNTILFVPGAFDPAVSKIDHATFEFGGGGGPNTIYSCQDSTGSVQGEVEFTTPLMGGDYDGPSITNSTFRKSMGNGIRGYCNVGPTNCLKTDYTKSALNNKFQDFTDASLPGQPKLGCP